MAIVLFFLFLAIAVPFAFPYNARIDSDLVNQLLPPSCNTDGHGRTGPRRDEAHRARGAQASLGVGMGAVLLAIIIGTLLGLFSGFAGNRLI